MMLLFGCQKRCGGCFSEWNRILPGKVGALVFLNNTCLFLASCVPDRDRSCYLFQIGERDNSRRRGGMRKRTDTRNTAVRISSCPTNEGSCQLPQPTKSPFLFLCGPVGCCLCLAFLSLPVPFYFRTAVGALWRPGPSYSGRRYAGERPRRIPRSPPKCTSSTCSCGRYFTPVICSCRWRGEQGSGVGKGGGGGYRERCSDWSLSGGRAGGVLLQPRRGWVPSARCEGFERGQTRLTPKSLSCCWVKRAPRRVCRVAGGFVARSRPCRGRSDEVAVLGSVRGRRVSCRRTRSFAVASLRSLSAPGGATSIALQSPCWRDRDNRVVW